MSESSFKKLVHKTFIKYGDYRKKDLHWQLHEDGLSVGIPDISYGIDGINGWIETKWTNAPITWDQSYNPKFQKYQESWLVARARSGGHAVLLHGFQDGFVLMNGHALSYRREGMTLSDISELNGAAIVVGQEPIFSVNDVITLVYKLDNY